MSSASSSLPERATCGIALIAGDTGGGGGGGQPIIIGPIIAGPNALVMMSSSPHVGSQGNTCNKRVKDFL